MSEPIGDDEVGMQSMEVLIVDDDQDFAETVQEILEDHGYITETAHSAHGALSCLQNFNPCIALLDFRLGHDNGIELIVDLKKERPNLICIMMTAYADVDTAVEAIKVGANDFLQKPLYPPALLAALDRGFEKVRLEREKEEAQKALQESENRFRGLIEGSLQGILIYRDFRPLFVNAACSRMLGYDSPSDILNLESLESLFDEQDLETIRENALGDKESDVFQGRFEHGAIHRSGQRIRVEAFLREVVWEGSLAIQATWVDVTQRAVLEEQLRQAQKMEAVGQLAGGVAHDFNNILQIIRGYTELAISKEKGEKVLTPHLEKVLKSTEAASNLTSQLLAFSRREVLRPRALDINRLIFEWLRMLRRLIGDNIEVEIKLTEDLPNIQADAGMLEQVLLNLCVNARDAMPDGGKVLIETDYFKPDKEYINTHGWVEESHYVVISITDTGVGMEPEVMDHIFEPFFSTKDADKGTGLGLSMVYGTVRQHKGMIDVASSPGKGATFKVYLPAGGKSEETEPPVAPKSEPVTGGQETLLVAEDEPEVLKLIVELLENQGYQVIQAINGLEACQKYQSNMDDIALVILDVVMPKMGGRAAYEGIRQLNSGVPVLFSTGYTANEIDPEFIDQNEFQLIRKPYSPEILFRAIRTILDAKKSM